MKTYQYHSAIFGCEVQSTYNKHGLLIGFNVINGNDVAAVNLSSGMLKNYVNELDFLAVAKQNNLKLTQVERVVTFELFWDAYKQKDCGRTKAEQVWNKLSKADQVEAFDFIAAFNGILKMNGTAKPYATTYLNSKRWIR